MMKLIFALALAAGACMAQEAAPTTGRAADQAQEQSEEGGLEIWKWVNFLVLAGGLGYVIAKNAGPFFAARSAAIVRDMADAQRQRKEAEAAAAAVDRRLAGLGSETAALQAESEGDLRASAERLARQTTGELARIQAHARQEIETAGKVARAELKRYAAELAVQLAGQKVRARMTPATENALVETFVRDLR